MPVLREDDEDEEEIVDLLEEPILFMFVETYLRFLLAMDVEDVCMNRTNSS